MAETGAEEGEGEGEAEEAPTEEEAIMLTDKPASASAIMTSFGAMVVLLISYAF